MPGEGEAPFLESQRFISRGLGLALLFVAVLTVALHLQIAPAWGDAGWGAEIRRALPLLILGPGLAYLFYRAELRVEVHGKGLEVRFAPFVHRTIPWSDLGACEATRYRPLEWGGWGILGSAKRRAYTVRGTGAVKLTLSKGGTLLIGTQRPEELARAIRAASGLSVP